MDELPELAFEKVLSYLSLEDRLKSRAVSRRWYHQINRFKVNTLCFSPLLAGFTYGKVKQNFICSQHFECFFTTFRSTILSNLKHLQLYGLRLNQKMRKSFARTLQSFDQIEELEIICCGYTQSSIGMEQDDLKLSLPMLAVIQLKNMYVINRQMCVTHKLTLDSPRLRKITLYNCSMERLELVHPESVEWLMLHGPTSIAVEKLKNLKYLYADLSSDLSSAGSTFLSSLKQLKEIHLQSRGDGLLEGFFEEKQRHDRTDLKIYLYGLLLNGPEDPAIGRLRQADFSDDFDEESFGHLAESPFRLADQIPFFERLYYTLIERVAPGSEMSVLKRFTHLYWIGVSEPVVDTDRFLNLLKNLHNIVCLVFQCNQPQALFDRLPDHSAIQILHINRELFDYRFLFRMKHLVELSIRFSIDAQEIREVFSRNMFLSVFSFHYLNKWPRIEIEHPRHFNVESGLVRTEVPDLEAVIELITG